MAGRPPTRCLSVPPERTTEDGGRPKRARRSEMMPGSPAVPTEPLGEPRFQLTQAEGHAVKSIIARMQTAPVDPPILRANDSVDSIPQRPPLKLRLRLLRSARMRRRQERRQRARRPVTVAEAALLPRSVHNLSRSSLRWRRRFGTTPATPFSVAFAFYGYCHYSTQLATSSSSLSGTARRPILDDVVSR